MDALSRAIEEAIAGRRATLFDLLARGSRLPGPRMNEELADSFAQACRSRGARADDVAIAMARLDANEAPGATAREFLPVCGVYALAARAAGDQRSRERCVAELHAHADDTRFRVRDAVAAALARVGAAAGDALVRHVASWMDGYFHAAAVVRAMADEAWLSSIHESDDAIARLEDAFALLREAPRAAARWPGHKALLEALPASVSSLATRFGVPVLDMLERWSGVRDPVLRDVVASAIAPRKLQSRFGIDIDRVRRALEASEAPARNPDHYVGPTRDRSGKRRRR